MTHVPGRLFSVNPATTRAVPRLFARNERVIVYFDHEIVGCFAMVLVGALFVGSIETTWEGVITPPHGGLHRWRYAHDASSVLRRGQEMARFNMGSTVILLFPPGAVEWASECTAGEKIKMGQVLGKVRQ
jgi:phosphatidylserine decarboxylase